MSLYTSVSSESAKLFTKRYSTSFSSASKLFDSSIRQHIYNIYGLVRIADEIVDSYRGKDSLDLLDNLERETYLAIARGYSPNPIVHSFQITANKFGISNNLITPFFDSMRMDLYEVKFNQIQYHAYIYGSAEVIGLMCLKVFVRNNKKQYQQLEQGAKSLGAAYQKVNFLRDFAHDTNVLGRYYFPSVHSDELSEGQKNEIIHEIATDFSKAQSYIENLPKNSRKAVKVSLAYYTKLLKALKNTPAEIISKRRVRVSNAYKFLLLTGTLSKQYLPRRSS